MRNTTTNTTSSTNATAPAIQMPSMLKTFIGAINCVANWFAPDASSVAANASTAPIASSGGIDTKAGSVPAAAAQEPSFCSTIGGLFRSIAKGATFANSICNSDKGVVSKVKTGVELFKCLGSTVLGSIVDIFQGVIGIINSVIKTLTGYDKRLKDLKSQKMVASLLSSLMSGDDEAAPSFSL